MAIFYRGQQKNYQKIVQCFEFLFLCLIHKFPLKYTMRCLESPSEETTLKFSVNMIARATLCTFTYTEIASVSQLCLVSGLWLVSRSFKSLPYTIFNAYFILITVKISCNFQNIHLCFFFSIRIF